MQTKLVYVLLITAVLMLACYGIASSAVVSVTINGVAAQGFPALGMATGGLLFALLVTAVAFVVVTLVALGTSVVLSGVCILFLLAMLMAFSPILLPGAVLAIAIAWFARRSGSKRATIST